MSSRLQRIRLAAVLMCLSLVAAASPAHAASGAIKEFPLLAAGSYPESIAAGPDGDLWFTEFYGNSIGRISTSGAITDLTVPTASSYPEGIAAGPDGNLWFTEYGGNNIGRITPSGTITEFPVPTLGSRLYGIAAGPDGNLWFTEFNKIGRITPSGTITEFPVPTGSHPLGIAAGPDGNLWFTEFNKIGRVTPSGTITEFPLPAYGYPYDIAAGPDGNLWFAEYGGNQIGRISTSGTITEFTLPTPGSRPYGIATGSDGNLWFTEWNGNEIGRISTSGTITEFPIPTPGSNPDRIATGPDGNLWFTEWTGNEIGRLRAAQPGTAYALSLASGFAPMTRALKAQGTPVKWSFYGPGAATVTDSSGMGLFDSGSKSLVSYFSFQFVAAGSYPYVDSLSPTNAGVIKVPIDVSPTSGTIATNFTVTWSSAAAPAGYVFDVQIKRPGTSYATWQSGVSAPSSSFTPDAGTGTYSFRARLRNTGNGYSSGWSRKKPIEVS